MARAPALPFDMALGRSGIWDLNFNKVGETFEWEGYQGTGFNPGGSDIADTDKVKYDITILAPAGSKGIYIEEDTFSGFGEREWLLPRGQKFKVLEFDEDARSCTILLINDWD